MRYLKWLLRVMLSLFMPGAVLKRELKNKAANAVETQRLQSS